MHAFSYHGERALQMHRKHTAPEESVRWRLHGNAESSRTKLREEHAECYTVHAASVSKRYPKSKYSDAKRCSDALFRSWNYFLFRRRILLIIYLPYLFILCKFVCKNTILVHFQESHHSIVQFELSSGSFSLSQLFGRMEEAQRDLPVEDYSVSQNTLDNVSA